ACSSSSWLACGVFGRAYRRWCCWLRDHLCSWFCMLLFMAGVVERDILWDMRGSVHGIVSFVLFYESIWLRVILVPSFTLCLCHVAHIYILTPLSLQTQIWWLVPTFDTGKFTLFGKASKLTNSNCFKK